MTEDPTEMEIAIAFIAGVCAAHRDPMLMVDENKLRSLADEYARTHTAGAKKRGVTILATIAMPGLAEIFKPRTQEKP